MNIVNQIIGEDKTIKDLEKDYPDKIKILKEAFPYYMGETDLKILKTRFPDKWKYLTKTLAYPYEYFNSIEYHLKPVDSFKKDHFFSKLKNGYPGDEEIQTTMDILKKN